MKTFLTYGLAVVGLAMMGVALVSVLTSSLSYPAARLAVTNLLRTNANRAEMLCKSTPGTFCEAIAAAIKTAAMIGSQDPAVLATATKPAYDAAVMMVRMNWKQVFGKAKMGLMAVAGSAMIAISSDTMPPVLIVLVALATIAIGAYVLLRRADIERGLVLARAEILPEVDRAFAEGRYALPPR